MGISMGSLPPRYQKQAARTLQTHQHEDQRALLGVRLHGVRLLFRHRALQDALDLMISKGKIELTHLGHIRGRDIKRSIIMCSEVENMTKEHIQLLISRVGEGSALWLDGDTKQVDAEVFGKNSGMNRLIDRLKGHKRFGYVKLVQVERSETAAMADLLD